MIYEKLEKSAGRLRRIEGGFTAAVKHYPIYFLTSLFAVALICVGCGVLWHEHKVEVNGVCLNGTVLSVKVVDIRLDGSKSLTERDERTRLITAEYPKGNNETGIVKLNVYNKAVNVGDVISLIKHEGHEPELPHDPSHKWAVFVLCSFFGVVFALPFIKKLRKHRVFGSKNADASKPLADGVE